RLTTDSGPDFNARLGRGPNGELWLAWQAFRGKVSRIWVSRLTGDRWGDPFSISQPDSNAWEPAIAVDSKNRAVVVWDALRLGSYNIYTRSVAASGQLSRIVPVAATETFEAHADVAIDKEDRAWFTWDEGGTNWGLDSACAGMRLVRNVN